MGKCCRTTISSGRCFGLREKQRPQCSTHFTSDIWCWPKYTSVRRRHIVKGTFLYHTVTVIGRCLHINLFPGNSITTISSLWLFKPLRMMGNYPRQENRITKRVIKFAFILSLHITINLWQNLFQYRRVPIMFIIKYEKSAGREGLDFSYRVQHKSNKKRNSHNEMFRNKAY